MEARSSSVNEFTEWYLRKVKKSLPVKKRIVEEDPELALRLYNVFNDRDIGLLFIGRYSNTASYGASALLLADEMSSSPISEERRKIELREDPLPQLRSSLSKEDKDLIKMVSEAFASLRVGTPNFAGNYWRENQWDNIVRTMEER